MITTFDREYKDSSGTYGVCKAEIITTDDIHIDDFLKKEISDDNVVQTIIKKYTANILSIKNLDNSMRAYKEYSEPELKKLLVIDTPESRKSFLTISKDLYLYQHSIISDIIDEFYAESKGNIFIYKSETPLDKDFDYNKFCKTNSLKIIHYFNDTPVMIYPEHIGNKIINEINDFKKNEAYSKTPQLTERKDIVEWLEDYNIKDYVINDDLTIDVEGDVDLSKKNLTCIPVRFGKINGSFMCHENELITLKGCPHTVTNLFNCNKNKITSLEHGPKTVGGNYGCSNNLLTTLEYCPKHIPGSLNCSHNQIVSLENGPEFVGSHFLCNNNKLSNLRGCPQNHMGLVNFSNNNLVSLEGAPPTVFQLILSNNSLTSLKSSIVNIESRLDCDNNPITSLEGCTTIIGNNFSHKININNGEDLIKELIDNYEYNSPNTFILNISATQFNSFTQSQHLDNILPHKKNIVSKKKI